MRALALLMALIASPAWAQGKPVDCSAVVQELKTKPPANGSKARAELLWDEFVEECEAKTGGPGATFNPEETMAIMRVLYSDALK
jgi:hypothetical protein